MRRVIFLIFSIFYVSVFASNLVVNGDIEKGLTAFTIPSGVTINTSGPLEGKQSLTWQHTTSGDKIKTRYFWVPKSYANKDCVARVAYRISASPFDFTLEVEDKIAGVIASSPFTFTSASSEGTFEILLPCYRDSYKRINIKADTTSVINIGHFDNFEYDVADNKFNGKVTQALIDAGTLTITATTTNPTKATTTTHDFIKYSRSGDQAHIVGGYRHTTNTGAANGSGDYLFQLPTGLSFDSSKVSYSTAVIGTSNYFNISNGIGSAYATNTTTNFVGVVVPYDSTHFRIVFNGNGTATGAFSSGYNIITASSAMFGFDFFAPISGWAAFEPIVNSKCSSDIDCTNEFSAKVSSAGVVSDENLDWISGSCTNSTNSFSCTWNTGIFSAVPNCFVQSNGTLLNGSTISSVSTTGITFLTANAGANGATQTNITCKKSTDFKARKVIQAYLSKPYASAWLSANFTASSTVPINFDSIEYTSVSGLITPSATAWKFTAPESGVYQISGFIGLNSGTGQIMIYKNGSAHKTLSYVGGAGSVPGYSSATVKLSAGDYIDFRPTVSLNVTGGSISTANISHISIVKVAD